MPQKSVLPFCEWLILWGFAIGRPIPIWIGTDGLKGVQLVESTWNICKKLQSSHLGTWKYLENVFGSMSFAFKKECSYSKISQHLKGYKLISVICRFCFSFFWIFLIFVRN